MDTRTQQPTSRRWVLPFLAAVIAALAAILAGTTSASATVTAETRVGASSVVVEPLVGPPEHISAGQRLGNNGQRVVDVAATGVAANGGMAGVRATGQAGEAMAGIVKNTTRIPSASGRAAYRIPDELNSSVLGEVKNVSHLNYTSQLRDFAAYAQQEGLTFTLYTRGSTTFSSTLWNEINSGRIVLDTTRLGP